MIRKILQREVVLVLNKNWQAINVKTPLDALSMMFCDSATALYISGEDDMTPLKWDEWVCLPKSEKEEYVNTQRGPIQIPKIIVLARFNQVPRKRPKFTTKNLWDRDEGRCQYTGKKLTPNEGNIDHVIPKSRGGKTDWSNCVLSHKDVNAMKGDRTPQEAGLRLIRPVTVPKTMPTTCYIRNCYNIKEWTPFLINE
jgi:5-methylcytosine-specific restriction endonuclease McrA